VYPYLRAGASCTARCAVGLVDEVTGTRDVPYTCSTSAALSRRTAPACQPSGTYMPPHTTPHPAHACFTCTTLHCCIPGLCGLPVFEYPLVAGNCTGDLASGETCVAGCAPGFDPAGPSTFVCTAGTLIPTPSPSLCTPCM
jgi:hypothetical protein